MADSSQGQTVVTRTKINRHAVADFSAWAHALHVTEQELTDAVHAVADDARDVIVYLLTRANSHAHSGPRTPAYMIRSVRTRRRHLALNVAL